MNDKWRDVKEVCLPTWLENVRVAKVPQQTRSWPGEQRSASPFGLGPELAARVVIYGRCNPVHFALHKRITQLEAQPSS